MLRTVWIAALGALLASPTMAGPIGRHNDAGSAGAQVRMQTPGQKPITVTGVRNSTTGVDSFLGVPFAEAPIGELRFEHPVPKTYTADIDATAFAPVCMQENQAKYNATGFSEDCLKLNILAPAGASNKKGKLPVLVWIFGGGFYEGSANYHYSPPFIQQSTKINRPVVLVQINYRLGAFGWMYGPGVNEQGAANLGLRDQILALRWVKENIASFGGDPEKAMFGQSAGAISISAHLLNTTQDLFRGAILHSGAPSTMPKGPTDSTWTSRAEQFASFAGCYGSNTTIVAAGQTTYECLKRAPAETLVAANQATRYAPGNSDAYYMGPSIDGDLIPEQPINLVGKGAFSRVPLIIGNTRDEGFYSLPIDINDTMTPKEFIDSAVPQPVSQDLVDDIVEAYPNILAMGSPFGTGNETFGRLPPYKQYGAIQGDNMFQSRRRAFIRRANTVGMCKTWTFEWWAHSALNPPEIGVAHSSDLPYLFGRANLENNFTQAQVDASHRLMTHWINFAYDLDPNGKQGHHGKDKRGGGDGKSEYWPPHSYPENKNQLRMDVESFSVVQDDYREDQMKVWDLPGMAEAMHYRRGL